MDRKLILITGKGGVGKTTLAAATARSLAANRRKTLLVHLLQLGDPVQEVEQIAPNLFSVTLNPGDCFREYVGMKLKLKPLIHIFLGNRVTQYLEKAAPGVREMMLIGKIWHELQNYDRVVVDMPSTGYALTMIHTPFNFESLFPGGPVYHDAKQVIATLSDPKQTAFVIASLPEEMPAQESTDLAAELQTLMPENRAWLVINRVVEVDAAARKLAAKKQDPAVAGNPLWRSLQYSVALENAQQAVVRQLSSDWKKFGTPPVLIHEVAAKDPSEVLRCMTDEVENT